MAYYRVLAGIHITGRGPERKVHTRGDVVRSDSDLVKVFGPEKFERVGREGTYEPPPPSAQEEDPDQGMEDDLPLPEDEGVADGLENMSVAELRAFAEGEEIDLGAVRLKADIVRVIRDSLTARS